MLIYHYYFYFLALSKPLLQVPGLFAPCEMGIVMISLFVCRSVVRTNVLMLCCCFYRLDVCVFRCYLGILIVSVYFPQLS